ncbi:sensor histidine kinase [Geomonas sp.]|uniref:sensor histidine kinase n=1 Tax=Geomonas sp. TaxID=2651584 RepID=UPI002B49AF92|nr:sensor histidine kinase [Geomonas sp.]HJV35613.1 sensor histidine kinase [Geomonas sp.]
MTIMAACIFVSEDAAMLCIILLFPQLSPQTLLLMDSTLLLLFFLPLMYLIIIRPMKAHLREQRKSEEEMGALLVQLRNLSSHLQAAREEERGHIAREIHDELGQSLTALRMEVGWLVQGLSASLVPKGEEISSRLDHIIEQVQHISTELRPGILDDLGLAVAVEWQASKFAEWSGIACDSFIHEVGEVPPQQATALFRIVQEALTNVARHSQARRVVVKLAETEHGIRLKVTDNGKGIDARVMDAPESVGLAGMRERVLACGGRLKIRGIAGRGTGICVLMPLARVESDT